MRPHIITVTAALSLALTAHAQAPSGPAAAAATASGAGPASSPGVPATDGATTFVVTFKVKAGKEADFEHAFQEMSQGVRDHEPGNIYYELYKTGEPQTYVVLEHYKDPAAVAAHGKSPHGQKLFAALRDLLDGPPQLRRLIFVTSK